MTRLKSGTLYRTVAILLLGIAIVLLFGHDAPSAGGLPLTQPGLGIVGFAIGVVASLTGVSGGELLTPTITLLFGADVKLTVSRPTMIVGFTRYGRDRSFVVIGGERRFLACMAAGSILGVRRRPLT